jgi:hypothetical protein
MIHGGDAEYVMFCNVSFNVWRVYNQMLQKIGLSASRRLSLSVHVTIEGYYLSSRFVVTVTFIDALQI